jgi:hypothetical protein
MPAPAPPPALHPVTGRRAPPCPCSRPSLAAALLPTHPHMHTQTTHNRTCSRMGMMSRTDSIFWSVTSTLQLSYSTSSRSLLVTNWGEM